MKFKTVQASAFKSAFEVLKDILNDINVYFDDKGIRITTLDTARTALVDFSLLADNFEEYSCKEPVIAGINVTNTFKLLKTISNNDILSFEIKNKEILDIKIENGNKKSCTSFQLKLLDINEDFIEIPNVPTSVTTVMPSVDFQRICRDMNNLGNELRIIRSGDNLSIRCDGDFANQETVIECSENYKGSIEGLYSLKYLNLFTKATSMCSTVRIVQEEQNRFLTLKYNVANLGEMNFYMATKATE
jgi:proliferating cell nuclear antigen